MAPNYLLYSGIKNSESHLSVKHGLFPLGHYYGLNMYPHPKFIVEVLTLSISECDLIWRWGLGRSNQAKNEVMGRTRELIQYEWYPDRKRFGHRDTEGERPGEEVQGGGGRPQAKQRGLAQILPSSP